MVFETGEGKDKHMPMDGLTVGFAARELNEILRDGRIDKITQPERDTVVLVIRAGGANHRLLLCASPNNARCHLTMNNYSNPLEPPAMCMLMRKQISGARITEIRQVEGDRIVYVDMDAVNELGDHVLRRLVLEIMGRHSNLLLLDENDRILEATRHVNPEMSRVRQIQPGMTYLPPPAQDKLNPETLTEEALYVRLNAMPDARLSRALAESITGLSRASADELACRVLQPGEEKPADLKNACERLAAFLKKLPSMADARVLMKDNGEAEDVFPFAYLSRPTDQQRPCKTLSEALEVYFGTRDARERLNQKSATMIPINANLYQLKKGMTEAKLPDWNDPDGGTLTVPLDIRLTPSQNAQKYFKKYQKAHSAMEIAAQQRDKTLEETDYLEGMLLDVDKCVGESELEEIRQELVRTGYMKKNTNRRQQRQLPGSKPYRYVSADGIEILVGKNAAQNDRITLGAKGENTWLHAKDMPGSHVVICHEGEVPLATMKQAAMLAAWYSKGQRSSLVPVDYTLRKYVKKPSGAAPGKVIYTHQRTVYVTPDEAEIRSFLKI